MYKVYFSGGCHSGKSTSLNNLKGYLTSMGYEVIVFKENMHELMKGESIDAIRRNPSKYLEIEEQCVEERIAFERNLQKEVEQRGRVLQDITFVLIDRALSDCYYYIESYFKGPEEREKFMTSGERARVEALLKRIELFRAFSLTSLNRLPVYLEFMPLKKACDDKTYRPADVDNSKYKEYGGIHELNQWLTLPHTRYNEGESLVKTINLNNWGPNKSLNKYLYETILGIAREHAL